MATSSDPKAGRMMTLRSSDGVEYEVPEAVALRSSVIKSMTEVDCVTGVIPLLNVTSKILVKVIEYFSKHADAAANDRVSEEDLRNWDAKFVEVNKDTLQGLMEAANYMEIHSLLYLTCRTALNMIKKMTAEDPRQQENDSGSEKRKSTGF